jgi:hypothetical protein
MLKKLILKKYENPGQQLLRDTGGDMDYEHLGSRKHQITGPSEALGLVPPPEEDLPR